MPNHHHSRPDFLNVAPDLSFTRVLSATDACNQHPKTVTRQYASVRSLRAWMTLTLSLQAPARRGQDLAVCALQEVVARRMLET